MNALLTPLGKGSVGRSYKNKTRSIEYPMVNPMTKHVEKKTTFYHRLADDLVCGVGAYNAG
jgi:hypothetical protein